MRNKILLSMLLLLPMPLSAPAQTARNAVYFELGGSAILASVNYERKLSERWFGRFGASFIEGETTEDTERTFIFPLTLSSVSRPSGNHHLELGGGITVVAGDRQDLFETTDDDEKFSSAFATGIVGYRFQKPDGGFQFRAAFTPVAGGGEFLPWLGVSFGYAW